MPGGRDVNDDRANIGGGDGGSPDSEHFWLPPATAGTSEDSLPVPSNGAVTPRREPAFTAMESPSHPLRYGTPEDSSMHVDDDAPLCSVR